MMADLALLAWPPQGPQSGRQSAEQPAGGGLQQPDEPYVSRGREGGWSQREKGKGRGSTFTRTHSRTHIHTRKRTHSRTHMHTHICARVARKAGSAFACSCPSCLPRLVPHSHTGHAYAYAARADLCVCVYQRESVCLCCAVGRGGDSACPAHKDAHTHRHAPWHAGHMMADLALLAWPPQGTLSG